MVAIASGKPFRPSHTTIRQSWVPRFLISASTRIQYLAKALATATVKAGTTVTWINRDRDAHTVSAMSGPFHFPMLISGRSYHYAFTIPGRYDYLVHHPPVPDRHRGGDPR
jgi:hypothetical protein